jgi:hypothetical protein
VRRVAIGTRSNRHENEVVHLHAHSHERHITHDLEHQPHPRAKRFPLQALLVGMMRGMGLAALSVLTLETARSSAGFGLK